MSTPFTCYVEPVGFAGALRRSRSALKPVVHLTAWAVELGEQLKRVQSGPAGAIMAEADAARIIQQWEQGVPELKLKALLNDI